MVTFLDNNASNFVVEMALKEIYGLIERAYGPTFASGVVYGNFVHQVLMPRYLNPKSQVSLCDVDFYFQSEKSMKTFLEQEKERLLDDPRNPGKYLFCVNDTILTRVSVTTQVPNVDLNIDCVHMTLTLRQGQNGPFFTIFGSGFPHHDLREKVKSKECSLVNPELFLLTDPESEKRQFEITSRIFFDFHQKGWKLVLDSEVCDETTLMFPSKFRKWVQAKLEQRKARAVYTHIQNLKNHFYTMMDRLAFGMKDMDLAFHRERMDLMEKLEVTAETLFDSIAPSPKPSPLFWEELKNVSEAYRIRADQKAVCQDIIEFSERKKQVVESEGKLQFPPGLLDQLKATVSKKKTVKYQKALQSLKRWQSLLKTVQKGYENAVKNVVALHE